MRMRFVRTVMLITALLVAVPQAQAATLIGRILFGFHHVSADYAHFFVFSATGLYCGLAYITNVSTTTPKSQAFDANMEIVYSQDVGAPNHFGVWYNSAAEPPGGPCTAATMGELGSYYITPF